MIEPTDTELHKEQEPTPRLPRVLMVEDERSLEKLFRMAFEGKVDVERESYPRGKDAIDMLRKRGSDNPVDVLITDIGLEDGGEVGFDVVEIFKEKFPTAKVILLTGTPYKAERKYTPEQLEGLNIKVVSKPCSPVALLAMVKSLSPSAK